MKKPANRFRQSLSEVDMNAMNSDTNNNSTRSRGSVGWMILLSCLPLLLLGALPLHAQRYLGSLTGNVSDPTSAKVVGATVVATDLTTKFSTKAVTNGTGDFSIPFLTPDTYDVTVEAKGFHTEALTGVVLTAGADVRTDFTLSVGSQTETVTVGASSPLLDTTSANIGTTFTEQQVHDLPSMGRVPAMVASLAAGAYDSAFIGGKTDSTLVPWGGGPTATSGNGVGGFTRPTIDGVPDDALERAGTGQGGPYTAFTPSPESIQEVKIQTGLYDAQYGHGSGTVINQVLRSGTNSFHGAAYFVFRSPNHLRRFRLHQDQDGGLAGVPNLLVGLERQENELVL